MRKFLTGLLLVGLLALVMVGYVACVSTSSMVLDPTATHYPPTNPYYIKVFLDANDIPGEYEKLAVCKADGAPLASEDSVLSELKSEAAKVGANAIILTKQESDDVGSIYGREKHWECIAIRVK